MQVLTPDVLAEVKGFSWRAGESSLVLGAPKKKAFRPMFILQVTAHFIHG